jgi:hypothetical protein
LGLFKLIFQITLKKRIKNFDAKIMQKLIEFLEIIGILNKKKEVICITKAF